MKLILVILAVSSLLITSGCTGSAAPDKSPSRQQTPSQPVQAPREAPAPKPTPTPVPAPTPAPTPAPSPTQQRESGLRLRIDEPQDESVVTTSPIRVSGSASPNSSVTINDEPIETDKQGNFCVLLELEEGPNVIAVDAFDDDGNESSELLLVTFEP